MKDKIHMLSAPYISSADSLWNNFSPHQLGQGKHLFLIHWSSDGKMLNIHYISSAWIQEQVASDPQGSAERDRSMTRANCSVLGLTHRAEQVPRVLVKTLTSEEFSHLTSHIYFSSASLSCLSNIRGGPTVQSLQWMPKWYLGVYTLISSWNNDISLLIKAV